MSPNQRSAPANAAVSPTFAEALKVWLEIGLLSFGGPAGQIAMMHRMLVDERKWIDEKSYLSALNFCMLLPGPEAMQLATYVGWRLHGVRGGLAAGLLFVLPGALFMLLLSTLYALYGKLPLAEALFVGIKAAVLAIVIEALLKVSRRALKANSDWVVAGVAFVAIYALGVPFPVIVLAAGLYGFLRGGPPVATAASATEPPTVLAGLEAAPASLRQTAVTIAIWIAIWIVPLLAVVAVFGRGHVLSELAWFFSKLAVVTFGGAYAVLAYMTQEVVQGYRWLQPGEMLDALGLAETTPGPLILVNQFVGALAAFRHGGAGSIGIGPIWMSVLGAVVTLWATFVPCFLWIFAGAPWIERLNRNPKLKSALQAVTAAVVGVILNLTVWF
ncbi:MAG: chromate efflux transporter, partial [Hyphomicrobium sp.]